MSPHPTSPLGRAAYWSLVALFPLALAIPLFGAFVGALNPLEGAPEKLHEIAPDSVRVCLGNLQLTDDSTSRSYVLIPDVFTRPGTHHLTGEKNGQLDYTFRPGIWGHAIFGLLLPVLGTFLFSLPAIIKMVRTPPPPVEEPGDALS